MPFHKKHDVDANAQTYATSGFLNTSTSSVQVLNFAESLSAGFRRSELSKTNARILNWYNAN